MSEAEKKKRARHRRFRQRGIALFTAVLSLALLISLALGVIYYQMNRIYYIDYTENGKVDYRVYLKENDFYEEEYLEADRSYVASLIDDVVADFKYELDMDAEGVSYEYTYRVDSELQILNKNSNTPIWNPKEVIKPETTVREDQSSHVSINEQVTVDYGYYNDLATRFIDTYEVKGEAKLIVRLHIKVLSVCEEFESANENEYVVALNIPLAANTLNIEMNSSVPAAESKILACDRGLHKDMYKDAAFIGLAFSVFVLVLFVTFLYTTRNRDIKYTIRVRRLVSAY